MSDQPAWLNASMANAFYSAREEKLLESSRVAPLASLPMETHLPERLEFLLDDNYQVSNYLGEA